MSFKDIEKFLSESPQLRRYFITCARGLEPILAGEIRGLGGSDVQPGRGGVHCTADPSWVYRANLCLRTAIRVLVPLIDGPAESPDELYELVRSFDWSAVMSPDHTLAVDANVRDSKITHSLYASRRVKDAVCDQFRDKLGRRPSVDAERPMVGINLHVSKDHAVVSLDSSGDSLHKRGYRPIQTIAPINEALAAGLVLMTGWTGQTPIIDPMCGSATFLIEAAWLAARRPPGLTRKHFGFMGWPSFDVRQFTKVRDELRDHVLKKLEARILGYDQRRDVIGLAEGNARAAGAGHLVALDVKPLHGFEPPADGPTGIVICNPPYGERIGEENELRGLYRELGQMIERVGDFWAVWVFTGNPRLAAEIGHKPVQRIDLFNGKIPCRFLRFGGAD